MKNAHVTGKLRLGLVSLSVAFGVALCVTHAIATDNTLSAKDGTPRCVEVPRPDQVNLYYRSKCSQPPPTANLWKGKFKQADSDPFYLDGCAAVAGRNLLDWYGLDKGGNDLWRPLEKEMGINRAAQGIDAPLGCAGMCSAMLGLGPGCAASCVALIQKVGNKGARQSGFVNAMQRRAPPGYRMFFHAHRHSLEDIIEPLSEGNPPVAVINTAPHVNHFVVITRVYHDDQNRVMLDLANYGSIDWTTFERKWSRVDFGTNIERSAMDEVVGEKPYFLAYYSKSTNRELGKFCMDHRECRSRLCDTREGAGCVPNRTGKVGEICTDHAQCSSLICTVPTGKVAGKCAAPASLSLGQACNNHGACSSGLCDPRVGCVPNKLAGLPGDICSDHAQCKSQICTVLGGKLPGKCTAISSLGLGQACTNHQACSSKLCDPRVGCVPNRTGQPGDICSDHAQCKSQICTVPAGKIAGKCTGSSSLGLGQACNSHQACGSGLCDPRIGCVPNRTGLVGEICSDHAQCSTRFCSVPPGKIAGTCRTGR